MQGLTPNEDASQPASGRHRKPGADRRRRLPVALAGLVALIVVAVAVVVQLGRGPDPAPQGRGPQADPGATSTASAGATAVTTSTRAAAGASAGPDSPSTSGAPATSAPSATLPPAATGPQGRATALTERFDRLAADALPGALVATAPLGENVITNAGTQTAPWESTRLRNGLTVARNNDMALQAGKVTATSGVQGHSAPVDVRTDSGLVRLRRAAATDIVTQLQELDGPACAACQPVTLTSAQPSTITVSTTRGDVLVPAWSFGVQGSKARLVRPALSSRSLLQVSPAFRGAVPADVERAQLPLWKVALAEDGRTVTANLDRGEVAQSKACWRLTGVQAKRSVGLYATSGNPDESGTCADARGRVAFRLSSPLGARVMLDSYWQRAIPTR